MITESNPGLEAHLESTSRLSPLQSGMLFHGLVFDGAGVDVVQLHFELREDLDERSLKRAWECVTLRHEVLRTNFRWEDREQPRQEVHRKIALPWTELDWRGLDSGGEDEHLSVFLATDRQRGFDLARVPLWRLTLIRCGGTLRHLVWTFHHAILDGRSFMILVREVFAFYEAARGGAELELPRPMAYREYIKWLRKQDIFRARDYWRNLLAGFTTPISLAFDRSGAADNKSEGFTGDTEIYLSRNQTAALVSLARENELTLNTLVQGAWALLLSRYSGEEDVVFGATRACRHFGVKDPDKMVGLFINTLPVRACVAPDATVLHWLRDLRAQSLAMRDHEHTPLANVLAWSDVPGGVALFDSIVVFENFQVNEVLRAQGGEWLKRQVNVHQRSNFPVTLATGAGDELLLRLSCFLSPFHHETAARVLSHLANLLDAFVAQPDRRLGEIQMLAVAERHQLLVEWNRTQRDYPEDKCIHELFEEQAAQAPGRVALIAEDGECSYGELNDKANGLARLMIEKGIGRGSYVPLLMESGVELLIAELAVMKSGAAFVPLSVSWPEARIAAMLRELFATLLLVGGSPWTGSERLTVLPVDRRTLVGSPSNPQVGVEPDDPIYAIFTSGSTGKPKAAVNRHRGITNRFHNMNDLFGRRDDDVILATSAPVFDPSIWQFFWPLTNGAKTVLPSPSSGFDPAHLVGLMAGEGITVTDFVPSLLAMVVEQLDADSSGGRRLHRLRQVLIGGEAIDANAVYRFKSHLPAVKVANIYGPTETAIGVIYYPLGDRPENPIPIGRPLHNVYAVILDRHLNLVPAGVAGDLYVGGKCVGLGYLNDGEATRAAFIPNPFKELGCPILYRTGDRACHRSDGNIVFLGRLDHQVKVRGIRVELGEIESALRACPGVRDCVVVLNGAGAFRHQLVAYFTAADHGVPSSVDLRACLGWSLPDPMMPAAFVRLDKMPLTTAGKVDRKALPPAQVAGLPADDYVAPRTPVEAMLVRIWEKVLRCDRVGVHDNFFELGGHSLKALRMLGEIKSRASTSLKALDLFAHPTVAGLAAILHPTALTAGQSAVSGKFVAPIRKGGAGRPLFIIPGARGGHDEALVFAWMVPHLKGDRPCYVVQSRIMDRAWSITADLRVQAAAAFVEIRRIQPHGPYVFLGECVAAVVAMELTRQAEKSGEPPGAVILLDADAPARVPMLRRLVRRKKSSGAGTVPERSLAEDAAFDLTSRVAAYYLMLDSWPQATVRSELHLVLSSSFPVPASCAAGWKQFARKPVHVHSVTGDHDTYIRDRAGDTARVLDRILEGVDGES